MMRREDKYRIVKDKDKNRSKLDRSDGDLQATEAGGCATGDGGDRGYR